MNKYFKNGFKLLIQSPEIYLPTLLLYVLNLAALNLSAFIPLGLLPRLVIDIAVILIYISYSTSIPILFTYKQKEKKITPKLVINTSVALLKRLFLPIILLVLLFFLATIVLVIILIQIYGLHNQYPNILGNLFSPSFPQIFYTTALGTSLSSFLLFVAIYFSIEKLGFFISIAKSVKLSIKNIQFVLRAFLLLYGSYLLFAFIYGPDSVKSQSHIIKNFLISPLLTGISLWVSVTALLFYQNIKQKSK